MSWEVIQVLGKTAKNPFYSSFGPGIQADNRTAALLMQSNK